MKIKRWAVLLLTACLMSLPLLGGCEKEYEDLRDDKYITMVFTNTHYEEVESYAPEMKYLLGENDPSTGRMYAAGYIGPMLLTQSIEQMQEEVNMAFDMAEKFNIPVYFQLDDINNYTTLFGGGCLVCCGRGRGQSYVLRSLCIGGQRGGCHTGGQGQSHGGFFEFLVRHKIRSFRSAHKRYYKLYLYGDKTEQ